MTQKLKEFFSLGNLTHNDDFGNALAYGISGWQGVNWDPEISRPGFARYCNNITSDRLLYPVSEEQERLAESLIKVGGYGWHGKKLKNRLLNYAGWMNATWVAPCERRKSTHDMCFGTHDPAPWKKDDITQEWRLWYYQVCTE